MEVLFSPARAPRAAFATEDGEMVIVFCRFSAALIVASLVSLTLARMGYFDGYLVFLIAIAAACIVSRKFVAKEIALSRTSLAASSGLALLAGTYSFVFATTELGAGRDNGVYTLIAFTIAKKGEVDLNTSAPRQAAELLGKGSIEEYPGIFSDVRFGRSNNPEGNHPRFNHASPALRAAFVQTLGYRGLAISSAVFAAAAVFAFSILAVSLLGNAWGLAAAGLLMTNAAVVYVARSSLSEVYTLAFVPIAFFFCRSCVKDPRNVLSALIAGTAIGCIMLSRIDGYLITPLAFLTVFAMLNGERSSLRGAAVLSSSGVGLFLWSIYDLHSFATGYFIELVNNHSLLTLISISAAIWTLTVCLVVFRAAYPKTCKLVSGYATTIGMPFAQLSVFLALLVFFAYFARSLIADQSGLDRVTAFIIRAPREMTWYLTIPILVLAFWGSYVVIRRDRLLGVVVAIPGLILILFFVVSTIVDPDHPWAARRWVSYSIPMAILLATIAFADFAQRYRLIAPLIGACLVALYLYQQDRIAHNWWFLPLQAGWAEGFDKLAATLRTRGDPFYLASSPYVASVLTYVYDIPTAPISNFLQVPARRIEDIPTVCGKVLEFIAGGPSRAALVGTPNPVGEICIQDAIYSPTEQAQRDQLTVQLLSGWAAIENWGAWTDASTAALRIVPPHALLDQPITIALEGQAFVTPLAPTQRVSIYVGAELLKAISFDLTSNVQTIVLEIPARLIASKDEITMRFEIADPRSPVSVGVSGDYRQLGFGLARIRIF